MITNTIALYGLVERNVAGKEMYTLDRLYTSFKQAQDILNNLSVSTNSTFYIKTFHVDALDNLEIIKLLGGLNVPTEKERSFPGETNKIG